MKITLAEQTLICEMNEFRNDAKKLVSAILHGIEMSSDMLKEKNPEITNLKELFSSLYDIILSLQIGPNPSNNEEMFIYWKFNNTPGSTLSLRNNSENTHPLTERSLIFSLLTFEKEIYSRLAKVEAITGQSHYLTNQITYKLHTIILNYVYQR